MDLTTFLRILKKADGQLTEQERRDLQGLVSRYPFFQAARALLIKSLHRERSRDYPRELSVTASKTSDREVLYDFVHEEPFVQNTLADQLERSHTVAQETAKRTDGNLFKSPAGDENLSGLEESFPLKTEDPNLFVPRNVSGMMGLRDLPEDDFPEDDFAEDESPEDKSASEDHAVETDAQPNDLIGERWPEDPSAKPAEDSDQTKLPVPADNESEATPDSGLTEFDHPMKELSTELLSTDMDDREAARLYMAEEETPDAIAMGSDESVFSQDPFSPEDQLLEAILPPQGMEGITESSEPSATNNGDFDTTLAEDEEQAPPDETAPLSGTAWPVGVHFPEVTSPPQDMEWSNEVNSTSDPEQPLKKSPDEELKTLQELEQPLKSAPTENLEASIHRESQPIEGVSPGDDLVTLGDEIKPYEALIPHSPEEESLRESYESEHWKDTSEAENEIMSGIPLEFEPDPEFPTEESPNVSLTDEEVHDYSDSHMPEKEIMDSTIDDDLSDVDHFLLGDWVHDTAMKEDESSHASNTPDTMAETKLAGDSSGALAWMEGVMPEPEGPDNEDSGQLVQNPKSQHRPESREPGGSSAGPETFDLGRERIAVEQLGQELRSAFIPTEPKDKAVTLEDSFTGILSAASHNDPAQNEDVELKEPSEDTREIPTTAAAHNMTVSERFEVPLNEQTLKEEPGNRFSFMQWLQRTTARDTEPQAIDRDWNTDKARKFELVDRFIQTNPKINLHIGNQEEGNRPQIESEARSEEQVFFTETLARLFREQGNYDRALKAYEALQLKYPEKSGYFAALIQEVKDLQSKK